jgi:NAD(P)-dependent dehydrogenase (short-subunit alcohol dehydrogenase family)
VGEHGIRVLVVEPGAFRTKFLAAFKVTNSTATLKAYGPVQTVLEKFSTWQGKQPGDPVKGAEAIVKTVASGQYGLRMPLGPDCVQRYEVKVNSMKADLELVREVAMGTNIA